MAGAPPRLAVVGVMGSGRDEHRELAEPLGRRLAAMGVHLLTGGGGGVMASVSRGFQSVSRRRGVCLGILPGREVDGQTVAPAGYPGEWVEIAIRTHLPLSGAAGQDVRSRNHINVLTADGLVFLPGGAGTLSEAALAQRYGKPCIAYLPADHAFHGWPAALPRARSLDDVERFLARHITSGPEPR